METNIRIIERASACCGPTCCSTEGDSIKNMGNERLESQYLIPDSASSSASHMKLSNFKSLLNAHRDKPFHLILPNSNPVPACFHITEVAHLQKRFIDCGGKLHNTQTCQLQVWVWKDTEHRLLAGKMADILDKAGAVLPNDRDLDIEIEYEDTIISQYSVAGYAIQEDAVVLYLSNKHTDCLARDTCLPDKTESAEVGGGCCGA